jgi:hypothetical protein
MSGMCPTSLCTAAPNEWRYIFFPKVKSAGFVGFVGWVRFSCRHRCTVYDKLEVAVYAARAQDGGPPVHILQDVLAQSP